MATKKIIQLALLISMAGVMHVVETILPLPLPIPGFKLGLSNIITLFVIVIYGLHEALLVSFSRVILGTLMTGTLFSLPCFMGLAGAITTCFIMQAAFRHLTPPFSLVGVSILGAVGHSMVQLSIAMSILSIHDLFLYCPYLLLFSTLTGMVTGLIAACVMRKMPLSIRMLQLGNNCGNSGFSQ